MPGPRIAFIGAGSTVFMKNIVSDILLQPALAEATIALMDIDAARLADSEVGRPTSLSRPSARRRRSRSLPINAARSPAPTSSSSRSRSAVTPPARSPISRSPRNTASATLSPTRSASAGSCADCAPSRTCGGFART